MALAAIVGAGCGAAAEKAVEGGLEKAIEEGASSGDGDVDLDLDDGEMSFDDGEGNSMELGGGEIPEGFPTEMPVPDDVEIIQAISNDDQAGQNFTVAFLTEMSLDEVVEYYEGSLADNAWTETSNQSSQMGDMVSQHISVEGHGYTGGVIISDGLDEGVRTVVLSILPG